MNKFQTELMIIILKLKYCFRIKDILSVILFCVYTDIKTQKFLHLQ